MCTLIETEFILRLAFLKLRQYGGQQSTQLSIYPISLTSDYVVDIIGHSFTPVNSLLREILIKN